MSNSFINGKASYSRKKIEQEIERNYREIGQLLEELTVKISMNKKGGDKNARNFGKVCNEVKK